jgi:hypothetical protein
MAFDLLTKVARLIVGRRYTSTDLVDSQEAFTSTIQMDSSEIWSQTSLIPSSNLPYSSSTNPGDTITSGSIKFWYRFPLTVANNTATANAVWYFLSPSGSTSGVGSQTIDAGQQTNFISPKYSVPSLGGSVTDAAINGGSTGYNITVFTSSNGSTFGYVNPNSIPYAFDYKTGVLEFTSTPISTGRIYATVYQYVGQSVKDALLSGSSSNSVSSSYFSGSVVSASNLYVQNTASLNYATVSTGSFSYLSINNTGSAPASSSSSGSVGEIRFDNNFIYIYTNQNWLRVPIAQWKN